jgi:hypothetical protein
MTTDADTDNFREETATTSDVDGDWERMTGDNERGRDCTVPFSRAFEE